MWNILDTFIKIRYTVVTMKQQCGRLQGFKGLAPALRCSVSCLIQTGPLAMMVDTIAVRGIYNSQG